jgi:cytochrome c biogenesis protein
VDSSRPSDFVGNSADEPVSPEIGFFGWLRWVWRQLTSMRTALLLLLLLAAAAIPGSVYPQRSADPNGVTQYFQQQPSVAPVLDKLQLFDVYSSSWFSAIYILLFISLIGCVIPRAIVHAKALRMQPVQTPTNLRRMPAFQLNEISKEQLANVGKGEAWLASGAALLKGRGYRIAVRGKSISAERGYMRETGNLVFHISLIGVLISVGLGGGYSYSGQRVLVEGDTFVNNLAGYDSFSPGTFFKENQLIPFSMKLDKFQVAYDLKNPTNINTPLDFRATVETKLSPNSKATTSVIRVNEPLELPGSKVYLTGNGFAPVITIRDADGAISFSGPTPFLPQDDKLTSLGVLKVPDAKPNQFGALAFFYPTAAKLTTGAFTSISPVPINPLLTMNIYVGNLGLNEGTPRNVFELNVHGLKKVTGAKTKLKSIELEPGQVTKLPNGMGSITFDGIKRFASLDIDYNPGQVWVLLFAVLALAGLMASLLIPRRRVWVKLVGEGFEVAALARGDDAALQRVVTEISDELKKELA